MHAAAQATSPEEKRRTPEKQAARMAKGATLLHPSNRLLGRYARLANTRPGDAPRSCQSWDRLGGLICEGRLVEAQG